MKNRYLLPYCFLIFTAFSCSKNQAGTNPFTSEPKLYQVAPGKIDEASGMADSYANPGFLWVIEDSGNPPELHLLKHDGTLGKSIYIKNVTNRDWEDLAVAQGPVQGKQYVYIAETGNNGLVHDEFYIYRFEEPSATVDTVTQVDKITFKYDQGLHDTEAMFVDQVTKDIYLVTKSDLKSKIYWLKYPQSTTEVNTAVLFKELTFTGAVGASYKGGDLMIKTYSEIYFWRGGGTIWDMVNKISPVTLGYVQEPQGEAVAMSNDRGGFFTLSEKPAGIPAVSLSFYGPK